LVSGTRAAAGNHSLEDTLAAADIPAVVGTPVEQGSPEPAGTLAAPAGTLVAPEDSPAAVGTLAAPAGTPAAAGSPSLDV